jgi:hypothetical protein
VRDPKVRLRGLSEIATNPPHAFLLQCTYLRSAFSGHPTHTDGCLLSGVKRTFLQLSGASIALRY